MIKKPRSPAYFRRQEKEKLDRLQISKAEEAKAVGTGDNDARENERMFCVNRKQFRKIKIC